MNYYSVQKNYDDSVNRFYSNINLGDKIYTHSDVCRLPSFECDAELLNADLWSEFHKLGTEMIITKNGRCMFPTLCVRFHGLEDGVAYGVSVELRPSGGGRWTRAGGHWTPANPPSAVGRAASPPGPCVSTPHPLSPAPASLWSLPLKFNNLKLTNNIYDLGGCVILRSMHKYLPILKIRRLGDRPAERCFTFPETEFIAVTAYQNCDVAQLKIDKNPYAKGFRERDRKRSKVKKQQNAPSPIEVPAQCQPLDCSLSRDEALNSESSAVSVSSSSSDISVCGSPTPDQTLQRVGFVPYHRNETPDYLGYLMSEWSRAVAYGNMHPGWVHPQHYNVHSQWRQSASTWHSPVIQQKTCNNESKPKGSSFTIRALLQKN